MLRDRVQIGDWILYVSTMAVKKIEKKDADEIIDLLVSKPPIDIEGLDKKFVEIIKNSKVRDLTRDEIVYLLKSNSTEEEALYREAEITRKTYIRDFICVHGIIEFSSYCRHNCAYCGLRKDNSVIKRYRMTPGEIVEAAVNSVNVKGYKLLVLQSGEDEFYTTDILVEILKKIKSQCKAFIFISIGDRDFESYKKLREAGASGVLYRFETSNEKLSRQVQDKELSVRFEHLSFMKELKYFIATGSLIGLPGQTIEDLADDLLTLKKMSTTMISIGPFIPCPDTPFSGLVPGAINATLKMISVARLMMKNARIPVTTSLETLDPVNGRRLAMRAGANALMFNLTPEKYCKDYKIYPDRFIEKNSMLEKYALFNSDGSYKMLEKRLMGEINNNQQ